MTLKSILTPAAVSAMLALSTLPAAADSRDHNDRARARSEGARSRPQDQRTDSGRPADTRGYAVPRSEGVAPRAAELARPYSGNRSSVFVDGAYVGVASTFDGTRQPLTLAAGRHRIELQAPGYEPIAFDVDVLPGQVIPYQGGLPPGYGY